MLNKIKKEFGKRIRDVRKIKGITQEKLAEKSDIALSYIAMIEGGKRNPTLNFIIKIAKGLDVEIYQLFLFSVEGLKPEKEVANEETNQLLDLLCLTKKKASLAIIRIIKELKF